jgi:hypothetical protein
MALAANGDGSIEFGMRGAEGSCPAAWSAPVAVIGLRALTYPLFSDGVRMTMGRDEAIERGIRFFAERGATVVQSVAGLATVAADTALVFGRATFAEATEFDREFASAGPFWWVAFAEYERRAEGWAEYVGPEPGGLVRFDAHTGDVYHPPAL